MKDGEQWLCRGSGKHTGVADVTDVYVGIQYVRIVRTALNGEWKAGDFIVHSVWWKVFESGRNARILLGGAREPWRIE